MAVFLDTYPNDETTEVGLCSPLRAVSKGWLEGRDWNFAVVLADSIVQGQEARGRRRGAGVWPRLAGHGVTSVSVPACVPVHLGDGEQWLSVV